MAVAEKFLDLADIDPRVQEQGGGGGAQGVGAVEPGAFLDRTGKLSHVAGDDAIHTGLARGLFAKLVAVDRAPGPKDRTSL
jgi:hypothetical protein